MYIKYIILLCLTYYIPTATSIDEEEINILWKSLDGGERQIHVYDYWLIQMYSEEDPKELMAIISNYGHRETFEGKVYYKYRFASFRKAALDGHIQRWSKKAMKKIFNEIIPEGVSRDYVTNDDMTRYYKSRYPELELDIEQIMREHGSNSNNEYVFYFYHFRYVTNMGVLPKPLLEEKESFAAIFTAFEKIKNKGPMHDTIDHWDLMKYYAPQLKQITIDYGRNYNGINVLDYHDFQNAIDNGHLLVSFWEDNSSFSALHEIFNNMLPENAAHPFITHKDLLKYYQPKIISALHRYGQWSEEAKVFTLHCFQYKKAILEGHLPFKFYSKEVLLPPLGPRLGGLYGCSVL